MHFTRNRQGTIKEPEILPPAGGQAIRIRSGEKRTVMVLFFFYKGQCCSRKIHPCAKSALFGGLTSSFVTRATNSSHFWGISATPRRRKYTGHRKAAPFLAIMRSSQLKLKPAEHSTVCRTSSCLATPWQPASANTSAS